MISDAANVADGQISSFLLNNGIKQRNKKLSENKRKHEFKEKVQKKKLKYF